MPLVIADHLRISISKIRAPTWRTRMKIITIDLLQDRKLFRIITFFQHVDVEWRGSISDDARFRFGIVSS